MSYEKALKYMFEALPMYQRIGGAAYKADLENAYELDKLSGHPHKAFKTIHVAGTNGKGSVSHMLASVLQRSGYNTGLYTSPHLTDFRERIKVNGVPVCKDFVIKYIQRNQCFYEVIKPSFFEMTVFMALCYFKTKNVDIAIIETGLGGRLDTTNIISPIVSVITNIGFDHMQFLGNSLKDIAKEKAGIIKPSIPVVIGETNEETLPVFNARASLMEAPIFYAEQQYPYDFSTRSTRGTVLHHYHNRNLKTVVETDLLGAYQRKNVRTVLTALDVIRPVLNIADTSISFGFKEVRKNTNLLGRWQEVGYNPLTICDIAHNKEGIQEIVNQIATMAYKQLHMVIGFANDKNMKEILSILPQNAQYYFARASVPRSAEPEEVYTMAREFGLSGKVFNSVALAYEQVKLSAAPEDLVYIGGSTFIVSDFLPLLPT